MFVQASVDLGTLNNAFLVPQRAVTRGDDGIATIYVVSTDNKADAQAHHHHRHVGGTTGIVTDGVSPWRPALIVDGFQKFSAGAEVEPVEATIDDNGSGRAKPDDGERQMTLPSPRNALASFFIARPVFAIVLAIATLLAGVMGIYSLSISQYPPILRR